MSSAICFKLASLEFGRLVNDVIFSWKGRKYCGKRRICFLPSFSPFPHNVFRGLFNSLPNNKILDWFKLKACAHDKVYVTEKFNFFFEE